MDRAEGWTTVGVRVKRGLDRLVRHRRTLHHDDYYINTQDVLGYRRAVHGRQRHSKEKYSQKVIKIGTKKKECEVDVAQPTIRTL